MLIERVKMGELTVAVPCYVVARADGGDVNH